MNSYARNSLLFLCSFALVWAPIHAAKPIPPALRVQFNDALSSSPEIVFFGSSYTWRQIDPRIIERRTGLHTFNLGLGGAGGREINHVVKLYLDRCATTPKFVIVEARRYDFQGYEFGSPRYRWFRGRSYWANAGQAVMYRDRSWEKGLTRNHLNGWNPLPFRFVRRGIPLWLNLFAERWKKTEGVFIPPEIPEGASLIVIRPPTGEGNPSFSGGVWNFNDPEVYPDLFEEKDRSDATHLNPDGSVKFTERIADRLVGLTG